MSNIPVKHFYMIRHGETEANAAKLMAGSLDSPLTETGKSQARRVHAALSHMPVKPTRLYHSNLSRARDTAHIINEKLNLDLHEHAHLAEIHAGDWEGIHWEECRGLFQGWQDPPNGEKVRDFIDRIREAKNHILSVYDGTPLLVTHGGVFRAFWDLYGIDSHGVKNCTLYEFEPHEDHTAVIKEEGHSFPWKIWRYDVSACAKDVQRVRAFPHKHQRSEIDW